jgi:hypothetical protein
LPIPLFSASFSRALLCCFFLTATPVLGAAWTLDPSLGNPEQHQRLYEIGRKFGDVNFDPDANLVGTHTKRPPNKKQHSTRESTYYACGLLITGDPADNARAQAILKRIVTFQDTKPGSPTYGLFNWNSEDVPGDQNSAAFVGLTLADILDLDRRRPCLDPDIKAAIEQSVRLALGEVMSRDVDPGYTNIAMLSIAFASGGEKLLQVPGAGKWAEAKLDAVMKLAEDGEFAEYVSPTYTGVALQGAYMAQKLAFSDAFAAKAQATIDHLWKQVAASYHAPTYQLRGPYLRAYGDNMLEYASVRHLIRYRDGNFILGTVAFQDEWKQKRNLVAFWRNPGPAPLGMKVGFCIDESNESLPGFAGEKLHFYSKQVEGSALVGITATTDVPGQGVTSLVFDDGAVVVNGGNGVCITDGTMTTYLYPVSRAAVHYDSQPDPAHHLMRVTRSWNSSDIVGPLHVMAYLLVFRPADQAGPVVSDVKLGSDKNGESAGAKVDGETFSVALKDP